MVILEVLTTRSLCRERSFPVTPPPQAYSKNSGLVSAMSEAVSCINK